MQKKSKDKTPEISMSAANFIDAVAKNKNDMYKAFLKLNTDDLKKTEVKEAFLAFVKRKNLELSQ